MRKTSRNKIMTCSPINRSQLILLQNKCNYSIEQHTRSLHFIFRSVASRPTLSLFITRQEACHTLRATDRHCRHETRLQHDQHRRFHRHSKLPYGTQSANREGFIAAHSKFLYRTQSANRPFPPRVPLVPMLSTKHHPNDQQTRAASFLQPVHL